jgi:competence protein ComEC
MPFHPQPLFFVAIGLVAGTLVPAPPASLALFFALGLAALLSIEAIVRPKEAPLAALIAASAAAGAVLAGEARADYARWTPGGLIVDTTGPVVLEGRVSAAPSLVDQELRVDVVASSLTVAGRARDYRGHVRIFVRNLTDPPPSEGRVSRGDLIRAWVELRAPEAVRTPGGFDQLEWAMRADIHLFATCKSERLIQITSRPEGSPTWMDRARDRLAQSWKHVDDPLDRAVTASMVVGDEDSLDALTRDEFRASGLLHLLVVSGSQVAALILGLRRAMPGSLRISWFGCAVEGLILVAYCVIAGAGDSLVRATVMAVAFGIAVRVDLDRGGANFLFASSILLLAARPLDARDPGAQLSFTATLALVAFAGPLSRRLQMRGVPSLLADVVAATLVAAAATAPLTLMHFHRLSLVALPANLVAAPLAILLLYAALLTAALDIAMPFLAPTGGWLCGMTAEALRAVAHHAAAVDPDWRGPALPLGITLGFLGLVTASEWRRRVLPLAGFLASLSVSGLPRGDGRLHVWFLDVGQGDAILIETPGGEVAAIDAGPAYEHFDAGERVVSEALWTLGHSQLTFLAVTHRHADHEGGARFLARHFDPKAIYVNGKSRALEGTNYLTVSRGDAFAVDGVSFRVLAPASDWPVPPDDENARSLVLDVTYGATSFLLTGDASALSESLIRLPRTGYDVVKAGHHGARTSSSEGLVGRTRPRLVAISVGARNRFSHPSPAVVKRWSQAGALVWRTDTQHTLQVVSDGVHVSW